MTWFKQHADTIAILATFCAAFVWIDGKFDRIDDRFSFIEKDVAIIKTVFIMKQIMPCELAEKREGK